MKKILLGLMLAMGLAGCAPKAEPSDKPTVVVSFYILEEFTRRIVGDSMTIINLMPNGGDAHDFELSVTDRRVIEDADHVLLLGNDFEHWAEDVYAEPENTDGVLIVGKNVETISDPLVNQVDPHLWLSLRNAVIMLETIKDHFSEAYPEKASAFETNYLAAKSEFDALDQDYITALSGRVRDEFMSNHAAFGYLARDYGLVMIPIMGLEPDAEPDAQTLALMIDTVKTYGIPYVLYESETDTAVAEVIAEATGAKTGILQPIESLTAAQVAAGDDYLSIMRQNLESLTKAVTE
jgi:zinc transport system substrate-binding protein